MIEYLEGHARKGASLNIYTGCLHRLDICPVSTGCWARGISKRFQQVCSGDFSPRFHLDRLTLPLHWRTPRRVAVSFMGDLWGAWDTCAIAGTSEQVRMSNVRRMIMAVVWTCPQHQFLFLTKNPFILPQFNPWPINAWAGITLTGAEPPQRQEAMLEALGRVQGAGVRWLSYEPVLKPLAVPLPAWLGWVVVGGWSGRRPLSAAGYIGVSKMILETDRLHIPRWEKKSLSSVLEAPLHQELPGEKRG